MKIKMGVIKSSVPFAIIGAYKGTENNEKLWDKVSTYIYHRFDKDSKIYVSSDAGGWIKCAASTLNGIPVLDKFHVAQACRRATKGIVWVKQTGESSESSNAVYRWICHQEWEKVKDFREVYLNDPELTLKQRQEAKKEWNYLFRNREMIDNGNDCDYPGDSTEAHISHWLSERASSRPRCWSEKGIDALFFIKSLCISKINTTELYKKQKRKKAKQLRQEKLDGRIIKANNIQAKYIENIQGRIASTRISMKYKIENLV